MEKLEALQELWNIKIGHRVTGTRKKAIMMAAEVLTKEVAVIPTLKISEEYPHLGENYFCRCGVMFYDFENSPTNYCGNCGQRLR